MKEAIREEEEEEEEEEGVSDAADAWKNRSGKHPRRGRGKGKADGERLDGRAGPRSENVVLSKSKNLFFVQLSRYSYKFLFIFKSHRIH